MVIRNIKPHAHKVRAGRLGGLVRVALHGNPGTHAGRIKGGINSLHSHSISKTGFKTLLEIRSPKRTKLFAEFIGIVMGDGHVDKYQVTISTNCDTDLAHAKYVRALAQTLFGLRTSFFYRADSRAVVVGINSKAVCDLLIKNGIPQGSKQRLGVSIPQWIRDNPVLTQSCIRGLFDTDGCVFQDIHRIRGRIYKNTGIAFANNERHILDFFLTALRDMGLHPTQTSPHRVFLRRSQEITRYFSLVGSSNPKHQARFLAFRKEGK